MKKNVLLVTYGTYGDVFPFIALARSVRNQGCSVTVATLPQYQQMVVDAGAVFVSLGSGDFLEQFGAASTSWSVHHGINDFFGSFLPSFLEPVCELLLRTGGDYDLVLASILAIGARIAYDLKPYPLVTVCPYPAFFQSLHLPPVQPRINLRECKAGPVSRLMLRGVDQLSTALYGPPQHNSRMVISSAAPQWQRRLFHSLTVYVGDKALAPAINAVRAAHGLGRVRQVLAGYLFSPCKVLALFPDWFAPKQDDWPAHTEVATFQELGAARQEPSAALRHFLEQGEKPIVFTFGSCKQYNAALFRTAVEVLERLGARGVLVSRQAEDIPQPLPDSVFHATFEPFPFLFERARLVVHHAGIGTCADALRAGVPQLLVPFSYDQPDNATRLLRLGVGKILAPGRFTTEAVLEKMEPLLQGDHVRQACAQRAAQLRQQEAENPAVQLVLRWLAQGVGPAPRITEKNP